MSKLLDGEIPLREALDLEQTAKYFAILELFTGYHSTNFHNLRLYYDPMTGLMEPIAYDCVKAYSEGTSISVWDSELTLLCFADEEFRELFLRYFREAAADFDDFLARHQTEIDRNVLMLHRDDPTYKLDLDVIPRSFEEKKQEIRFIEPEVTKAENEGRTVSILRIRINTSSP